MGLAYSVQEMNESSLASHYTDVIAADTLGELLQAIFCYKIMTMAVFEPLPQYKVGPSFWSHNQRNQFQLGQAKLIQCIPVLSPRLSIRLQRYLLTTKHRFSVSLRIQAKTLPFCSLILVSLQASSFCLS